MTAIVRDGRSNIRRTVWRQHNGMPCKVNALTRDKLSKYRGFPSFLRHGGASIRNFSTECAGGRPAGGPVGGSRRARPAVVGTPGAGGQGRADPRNACPNGL
ncbi:hypothetical protein A33M_3380 [Rhodovulum sp. PH10]|nr:hypothetical protein A33M_3380 [Rhodovulum sp. PH10]